MTLKLQFVEMLFVVVPSRLPTVVSFGENVHLYSKLSQLESQRGTDFGLIDVLGCSTKIGSIVYNNIHEGCHK